MPRYRIRPIEPRDDARVEQIIRSCLVEYGADHAGTAWSDPELGHFASVYQAPGSAYWIAEDEGGTVVAGVGIAPLPGVDGSCELQKMYCVAGARGTGAAGLLMREALAFASRHYDAVYLETLENMVAAKRFYEKHGFVRLSSRMGDTGHPGCDVPYLLRMTPQP